MKKNIVTGLLCALCLAASSYIVLESAGYYQKLYILVGLSGVMGLYTAILSEAFQLVLVILLPSDNESSRQKYSLLAIVSLIYLMTIFAAGMNVGKPLIENWSQSNNQAKLLSLMLDERNSLNNQVRLLHSQNQKVNTILSIQAERESFQEIKNHLKNGNPVDSTLIKVELAALWLLRILIQLANLFCGRMIATRIGKGTTPIENQFQRTASANPKIIRKWKAKYTREENGFVGIMELDNRLFLAVSPDKKKKYKTFQGALGFFDDTPYQGKIPK
ncbi:hypothetical protein KKI24_25840 [bacterium]|nr:hypothetical protein [bacterium]